MRQWTDIAALGLTQTIGYGTLYFSFSILTPAIARDFGLPSEWMFGAFSVALLLGGLIAPLAGRWIDRYGAGRVMTIGSLAAALTLVACALAPSGAIFLAALLASEVSSTFVQYGAAFSLLVQRHHDKAQRSIVYLTLVAGFTSTIFWPLTTWLNSVLSWQHIYLIFAAAHFLVCLPIHAWMSGPSVSESAPHASDREGVAAARPDGDGEGLLPPEARRKGFALMAMAFAFQSFVTGAILVHLLPMLQSLGLGLAAVAVGTVFGPAQVFSRLINIVLGKDVSQITLAFISVAIQPLAIIVLLFSAPSLAGAMVFAVAFGMGNGIYSIVAGTLPLVLFGRRGYGARQGRVMSARLIVGSVAPFAFAVMMERIGTGGALVVSAALSGGSMLALTAVYRLLRRQSGAQA